MPTLEFLTPPGDGPCLMRGSTPPGGVVPLHSHPDPETFYAAGHHGHWLATREENTAIDLEEVLP